MRRVQFKVEGHLPPKKGGVSSMWNKKASGAQKKKLVVLRDAAAAEMKSCAYDSPLEKGIDIRLSLRVYVRRRKEGENAGDLDNFITGVCDGLVAAKTGTVPDCCFFDKRDDAHDPGKPIVFEDDSQVREICAERVVHNGRDGYSVELRELEPER